MLSGFLILDKFTGMTSRTAVDRASKWFPRKTKLGHTGTLDPLATGVLVLGIGQGTRLTELIHEAHKSYDATIQLGASSDTDDADGEITITPDARIPDESEIVLTIQRFVGLIQQTPPNFSAVRHGGRRAYDLARKGQALELTAKTIRVDAIRMVRYYYPELQLQIDCGKGTYIRSIARDLGQMLGCGGYIQALRRTRIGSFGLDRSVTLESDPMIARSKMIPLIEAVPDFPKLELPKVQREKLGLGGFLKIEQIFETGTEIAITTESGDLHSLAEIDEKGLLRPNKVFIESRQPG
jgi:tRNA pseudouridine55 synthase